MPKFHFRLETLLNLRRDERDAARRNHAKALEAQRILQDQIEAVDAELAGIHSLVRSSAEPGPINVDRLLRSHRYELLLATRREQLKQQAIRVAEETDRRRQQLMRADREVRLLEKLRERQFTTFQQAELKREQYQMDEVAQRFQGIEVDNR